ncbi:MAG: ImmA/IrrE family metallo-endopeptidase [Meiothermus sp.]|nr:ImmA/IrrE family metallo-endopeptidase [Meiothermus sp.]
MKVDARGAAQKLLKQVGSTIPVDVYALAQTLGVSVVEESLDDPVSGFLIVKKDKGIVAVNKNHHTNRRRFSVAHELGHFVLHRQEEKLFVTNVYYRNGASDKGVDPKEIQANAFAAALLMPEDTLRQLVGDTAIDLSDEERVKSLAAKFEVSLQAMLVRLSSLGLIS